MEVESPRPPSLGAGGAALGVTGRSQVMMCPLPLLSSGVLGTPRLLAHLSLRLPLCVALSALPLSLV